MNGHWTLERVAQARPEIAPLARLHAAIGESVARVALDLRIAAPPFAGTPALHWLEGRALVDAADPRVLAAQAAPLFHAAAAAASAVAPGASRAIEEMLREAAGPGFSWEARVASFREIPEAGETSHPALFRFILLRALAPAAGLLAAAHSAPHPQRWLRSSCPWCGLPAAASIAGEGGGRTLLCLLCGGAWRREGLECIACGEERADTRLVLADRELGPASLEACATCRGALKAFARADLGEGPPVALEVLTVHLDVLARSQGYSREDAALAAVFPPP